MIRSRRSRRASSCLRIRAIRRVSRSLMIAADLVSAVLRVLVVNSALALLQQLLQQRHVGAHAGFALETCCCDACS